MERSRRQLLAATGALLSVTAGCLRDEESGPAESDTASDHSGNETTSDPTDDDGTVADSEGDDRDDANDHSDDSETADEAPPETSFEYDVFWNESTTLQPFRTDTDHRLLTDQGVVVDQPKAEALLRSESVVARETATDPGEWLTDIWLGDAVLGYATLFVPNRSQVTVDVAAISIDENSLTAEIELAAEMNGRGPDDEGSSEIPVDSPVGQTSVLIPVRSENLPETVDISIRTHRTAYDWFDVGDALIDPDTLPGRVAPDTGPVALPDGDICPSIEADTRTDPSEIAWGSIRNESGVRRWALSIASAEEGSSLAFESGEEITITMTNTSYSTLTTGSKSRATVEVLTTDGWQPVVNPTRIGGLGMLSTPGKHFEWTLELTPDGIAEALGISTQNDSSDSGSDDEGDRFDFDIGGEVCEELPVGRYRFSYPVGGRYLAVAFDYLG